MSGIQEISDVEQFCQTINASMGLSHSAKQDALAEVSLPAGFCSVFLRYAGEEKPVVFIFSRKRALSAASVASSMSLKGSTDRHP